jgi:hypothetical protein
VKAGIDDTLHKLEKERELYNAWKFEAERQMVETLGEGTIEIMEEYDEEREMEWRKQHRESVKNYHQKRAEARKNAGSEGNTQPEKTETELWTRLDALELEEEFMEAQAAYEEKIYSSKEKIQNLNAPKVREKRREGLEELLEANLNSKIADLDEPLSNGNAGKKVTFNPENIIHNLTDLSMKESKRKGKEAEESEQNEEFELYKPSETCDSGLFDPIFIRFRHGPAPSSQPSKKSVDSDAKVKEENSSGEETDSDDSDSEFEDYQVVLSPGDIFEQFGPPSLEANPVVVPGADKAPLKSILKPRCPTDTEISSYLSHNEAHVTAKFRNKPKQKQDSIVLPQISERNEMKFSVPKKSVQMSNAATTIKSENNHTSVCSTKPLSLFKRMKQGLPPPPEYQG